MGRRVKLPLEVGAKCVDNSIKYSVRRRESGKDSRVGVADWADWVIYVQLPKPAV